MLATTAPFLAALAPLVAMLPVFWLFYSLGVCKMDTHSACAIGLGISLVLASVGWGFAPRLAALAVLDGAIFAFMPIIWVIFAALLVYSLAVETKALDAMKALLASISPDRRIQALLIAWGFGGFMEAVAGFGTAVVVPAAMLIAIGFAPFTAALICLLANTVAVAFGVLGIPILTLAWVTDLPLADLAPAVALQLFPFVFVVPGVIVLVVTRSVAGLIPVLPHTLVAGGAFGLVQFVVARHIGPELPAVLGSIAALGLTTAVARIFPPRTLWRFANDSQTAPSPLDLAAQCRAWSPYLILLALVLASRMIAPLAALLGKAATTLTIYPGQGGKPMTITWLLTPGSLVMVAAVLGGLIQGATPAHMARTAVQTAARMGKSIATIVCIVAMAKVLSYSGMVAAVAAALADVAGKGYPFVAPIIGMLGSFITGSDTSANILFGQMQKEVALSIGASPVWIAAANTSGACIGKIISLQSITIAGIAANLEGREGTLLITALAYALPFITLLGLLVLVWA